MRLPLVLLSIIVIAGCAPEKPPAAETGPVETGSAEAEFRCGAANILIAATDVGRIEEAFGPDGIGDKVCAIFADAARRAAAGPEAVTATLPTSGTVTAQVVAAPADR
jgi:hypothetical protein